MPGTLGAGEALVATEKRQYLTFMLGQEQYGIEILCVQEIKGYTALTAIPNTPPRVKGVMNLRGTVVPVLDVRVMFGMPEAEYDRFTVVIVVNVLEHVVGLIVDAVSDVLDVDPGDMAPPPEMGAAVDTSYITGLAKTSDRLIALLALERVVGELAPASLAA